MTLWSTTRFPFTCTPPLPRSPTRAAPSRTFETGETFFVECDSVVNGIGFVPTPVGGKAASKKVKGKETIYRVGDCVAIGNLRTVIWRAWDVCMAINGNNQGIEKIVDMII